MIRNLILSLTLCLFGACAAPSDFVGFVTASGNGDVRTDGTTFVAMGLLQGDAGMFLKGSGFPLTLPLDLKADEWTAMNRTFNVRESGTLGVDPLPYWCATLFRPGEVDELSDRLGVDITFRPAQP